MIKIMIGEKTQRVGYFELSYKFILDVPAAQIGKESQDATKEISGVASYPDNTAVEAIKSDLINRYNKEQASLNLNTRLFLYNLSWDGSKWSA